MRFYVKMSTNFIVNTYSQQPPENEGRWLYKFRKKCFAGGCKRQSQMIK